MAITSYGTVYKLGYGDITVEGYDTDDTVTVEYFAESEVQPGADKEPAVRLVWGKGQRVSGTFRILSNTGIDAIKGGDLLDINGVTHYVESASVALEHGISKITLSAVSEDSMETYYT